MGVFNMGVAIIVYFYGDGEKLNLFFKLYLKFKRLIIYIWIIRFVKGKILKLLGKSIREFCYYFGVRKDFLK